MKAIGIARQSRGDDNSQSVAEQEERIRRHCEREGWELVGVLHEQDVSGGRPLDKRPGLREAVCMVEDGDADVIVVAYFDRLVRSLDVQREVTRRVEEAGGELHALDVGAVSHKSATKKLTANFLGALSEHYRDSVRERVRSAHERLASEGKWLGGKVPIGYRLGADGRLEPDENADVVVEAYMMRERGASLEEVRAFLRERTGLEIRSLVIVQRLLRNPVYLGRIERGDLVNAKAHEAIVPADLFRRVAKLRAPRGARSKSDRQLARLGVLRCGSCGSRMVVATATGSKGERIYVYRCPPGNDCTSKQSITATIAEEVVVHATRLALRELEGRAGGDTRAAEARVERARTAMANAVETFDGFGDVAEVRSKLTSLREELEAAEDDLDRAMRSASFRFKPGLAWDELTDDERRGLIRTVVERAEVMPGRGAERVQVTLAPELADVQRELDRAAAAFREDLAS